MCEVDQASVILRMVMVWWEISGKMVQSPGKSMLRLALEMTDCLPSFQEALASSRGINELLSQSIVLLGCKTYTFTVYVINNLP